MVQTSWEWKPYTKTIHRSVYPAIDPTNAANSAAGKVILVTGGGSGVGKLIAAAFNKAGAKAIVIVGRSETLLCEATTELEKTGKAMILSFTADVADEVAMKTVFATAAKELGPVDVVVANAGYLATPEPAASSDVADWWKSYGAFGRLRIVKTPSNESFEIKVKGTFLTFRAWLPHKSTSSLNTAAAHVAVFPGFSSYSPSEMARGHMISILQADNPDTRVVSMHPGVLDSEMGARSGLPLSKDEMSLPTSFAVWLTSPVADWVGGRFFWAHWDVDELAQMKDEIVKNNELMWGVIGWPKEIEATIVA